MTSLYLRSLLILMALIVPAVAGAQDVMKGFTYENPTSRRMHYYYVRSYPFGRIPQGARLQAIDAMQRRTPNYLAKSTSGLQAMNQWRLIGPKNVGGRINAIAVHPTDGQTLWVGAASGGVWKSTNRGSTWTPIMDFENAIWIGSLAVDPTNADVIYAGTGDPHPSNGDSYPGAGIMKTTDGGATWKPMGLTNVGAISAIIIDPRNPNNVVAGGADNNAGTYRSVDAGATWVRTSPQSVSNMVMNPRNPDQLWIGTWSDGVMRSSDQGVTWRAINTGMFPGATVKQRTTVAVCAGTPNVLYTLSYEKLSNTDQCRVYRSTNSGDTWQTVFDNRQTGFDFLGNIVQSQGSYNNIISVKPDDPNSAIAGGVTVARTTNSGTGWTRVSPAQVHDDHHAMAWDPSNPNVLYEGNDGGMYRSDNAGSSFTEISSGLAITQFYAIAIDQRADDLTYGGTQDNGTYAYTSDDATRIAGGDGFGVVVDHSNSNIIYGMTPYGDLWKLDRSTNSFMDANTGLTGTAQWSAPLVMDPVDASVLYHGREGMFKSLDGAASWSPISDPVPGQGKVSTIAVSRVDNNVVFAGTNNGILLVTRDGENFVDRTSTSGLPNRYFADFATSNTDAGTAFVCFGGFYSGHVFKTTDYGVTWRDVSSNLPDIPVNALALHPDDDNTIFAGSDIGVFVSLDGGASWARYSDALPRTEVLDMEVHRAARKLRIATYGRSAWEIDLEKPTPPPSITAPIGGEVWTIGSSRLLGWAGFSGAVDIELSVDDGKTFTPLAQGVAGTAMRWIINATETQSARIRVTSLEGAQVAVSRSFTIEPMKVGGIVQTTSKSMVPYSLAYDGEFLYTHDFGSRRMLKMDPKTFETLETIETQLVGGDSLVTDLAYHSGKGNFFVHRLNGTTAGAGPGWLYEMTRTGQQVNRWRSPAAYPIGLAWLGDDNPELPYLLATDRDGEQEIYLIDPENGDPTITIPRARKVPLGPRGATSAGGGTKFFQVLTLFGGTSLEAATAELMTVEEQTQSCVVPLATSGGLMNARGIEYDSSDKNIWVSDYTGNIYKLMTCDGILEQPRVSVEMPTPEGLALAQNQPNPFRGETEIAFTLQSHSRAKLVVHDATGNTVATLVDESREAGTHRVRFAPIGLASGVYRYTLTVDGRFPRTLTMVYVR